MPTYSINMNSGDQSDGWNNAATALGKALTPDYKGMAEGKLRGAQTESAYASGRASDALARDRAADAFEQEARNKIWTDFRTANADKSFSDVIAAFPKHLAMIGGQYGINGSNMGDNALAGAGIANADAIRTAGPLVPGAEPTAVPFDNRALAALAQGAQVPYQNTEAGVTAGLVNDIAKQKLIEQGEIAQIPLQGDQDRLTQAPLLENDLKKQRLIEQGEIAQIPLQGEQTRLTNAQEPVSISENQIVRVPEGHPLWTPQNNGIIGGQRSVAKDEMIYTPGTDRDGNVETVPTRGIQSTPTAPEPKTFVQGNEQYSAMWDPAADGFVEIPNSRGPRTGASGEHVQDSLTKAMQGDDNAVILKVRGAGFQAGQALQENDLLLQLMQSAQTGPITEWTQGLREVAQELGLWDGKEIPTQQAMLAQVGNMVMERIQDTKGAVSDAEMAYFKLISPSMSKTPEGNRLMVMIHKRINERAVEADAIIQRLHAAEVPSAQIRQALVEHFASSPIIDAQTAAGFGLAPPPAPGVPITSQGYTNPEQGGGGSALSSADLSEY